MEFLLLLVPIIAAGAFWLVNKKILINLLNIVSASLLLIASFFVVGKVISEKIVSLDFYENLIYIDSFSALVLIVITVIGFLVSIYSISYINEEYRRKVISIKKMKAYYSLLNIFIFTMVLTTITQNMGVIWIAIEGTTLASAFLVGFYNNKKSLEAAWKYIIICSVGITFALLGIILVYYSTVHSSLGQSTQGLNWSYLFKNASELQNSTLKLAFIFILIGFGTKVGLSPMHTWLPDAHSQAPSPISALLSGVLLNTAMYSIVRVMVLVNKNNGSAVFTGKLMMVLGILSIGTAAIFILAQNDLKRLLAYSSIEHMGIIALGFGISSSLSVFAALFHIVNHAFTKSMLFIASGNIYLKYETKSINKINGLLKILPVTGTVFLLGILAITGMPPFSIFASEINIIISSFTEAHYLSGIMLLLFLTLIFAGFILQLFKIFYGKSLNDDIRKGEISKSGAVILLVFIVFIAVTGFYIPAPLKELIESAKLIIMGSV